MQIPILNGIYTDQSSDFRIAYPYNLVPIPVQQGISQGYLRPADGVLQFTKDSPGVDRGGINWNGTCYRVMGNSLVSISGTGVITTLGTIPGVGQVKFDYSFDYLAIRASEKLFLYNGTLTQITDTDLGLCVDFIWVDGYFMSTDGEFIAVTELNNPFSVLPTKYGSSESDPDPVLALLKLHNEPTAINRYTIETFSNIGGEGFPFARVDGALISKGAVGTNACCVFMDNIAFVGCGRDESVTVYLASNGQYSRIATREVDLQLASYTEAEISNIKIEARVDKGNQLLYIHLPDRCLVYDGAASSLVTDKVWYVLGSGITPEEYRAKNFVWCYNKWLVGDTQSSKIGYIDTSTSNHWGETIGWEFSTAIMYNDGVGAIFHELELVCLSGRVALGAPNPMISTQYSLDGETWSQPKYITTGTRGECKKRLVWLQQGSMRNWRAQKFNGTTDSLLSVARLEARLEGLMV